MSLVFSLNRWGRKSLSEYLRGEQVAEALGAPVSPSHVGRGDTVVYVKRPLSPMPRCRAIWFDLVDNWRTMNWLGRHPEIGLIAMSRIGAAYLEARFGERVVLIPPHHCNHERMRRARSDVTVAGWVGRERTLTQEDEQTIRAGLADAGIDFRVLSHYEDRQDIVRFYQSIDVQIAWRLPLPPQIGFLKNAMKLANAGSFGIPTVARRELACESDYRDAYWPVESAAEVVDVVRHWRESPVIYADWCGRALRRSEAFHLDVILPKYQALESDRA